MPEQKPTSPTSSFPCTTQFGLVYEEDSRPCDDSVDLDDGVIADHEAIRVGLAS